MRYGFIRECYKKEPEKELRRGDGRANMSFERSTEEFMFGLLNKILSTSSHSGFCRLWARSGPMCHQP